MPLIRLIDQEGVTWCPSLAVPTLDYEFRFPVPPKLSARYTEADELTYPSFRVATFNRTNQVTGDGHTIYRLEHL